MCSCGSCGPGGNGVAEDMVKKLIRRKKTRGVMLVEVALVLPMLLLVSLGAIRYGHLFLRAQEVTNAARHGARTGIRVGSDDTDVQLAVENMMAAAGMPQASSGYALNATANVDTLTVGQLVTVQIAVPVGNVGALHVPLFTNIEPNNGNWNIVASVTMAKENF